MQQNIEYIEINKLHLWSENPRDPIDKDASDFDIILHALKNEHSKWDLDKLLEKMGDHYDFSELPTVVQEEGVYIVYDGNRRLALVKLLQDQKLYQSVMERFILPLNIDDFIKLSTIPCNVCDKETALSNIERKHVESGSWKALERDYFLYRHRKKSKSAFLIINEATQIIENNKDMNQDFVKSEILTMENLHKLGFSIKNNRVVSVYNREDAKSILDALVDIVCSKTISTRNYRGDPLSAIKNKNKHVESIIKSYSIKEDKGSVSDITYPPQSKITPIRRTPRTKQSDVLFGGPLSLKPGKINDLYLAIEKIYDKNKNDPTILPVVGMSLRLLVEITAREQFEIVNGRKINSSDKNIYENFMKSLKQEISQSALNFSTVTKNWLNKEENIEAILGKYAHGQILCEKTNILKTSEVVADILNYYCSKL